MKTPAKKPASTTVAKSKTKPASSKRTVAAKKVAPKPKAATPVVLYPNVETGSEQFDSLNEMVRQYAENGFEQSLAAFDGLRDAADAATLSFDDSTEATRLAGEKVFAVMTDLVTSQSKLTCDTMKAMAEAGSVPAAMEIWAELGSKQFDIFSQKQDDLTSAFTDYIEKSAKPFADAYGKGLSV